MHSVDSISAYLRHFAHQLEDRILHRFPPLHQPDDPLPNELRRLRRTPYPAQSLAIAGLAKRLESETCAGAIAECGTGKTLISLGAMFVHAKGKPFTALAMVPPQLVTKMARECFLTLPRVRVFLIDGVRNGVGSNGFSGVNEVRLRNGRIVREGLHTTLSDLRLLEHIVSMCNLAVVLTGHYPRLNLDWLIAGAILHDLGKIETLALNGVRFEYTSRGQLIEHVALGLEILEKHCSRVRDFPIELKTVLQHLIVSHHGDLDKGALRRPMFPEAFAVSILDLLDARLEQVFRTLDSASDRGPFTPYVPSLERQLFRGFQEAEAAGGVAS